MYIMYTKQIQYLLIIITSYLCKKIYNYVSPQFFVSLGQQIVRKFQL